MEIAGRKYKVKDTFDSIVTIPDCFVLGKNKLGHGHGEAKLYFGSKDTMRSFYGEEGFKVKCFLFKKDLITYLKALKEEYKNPSQDYVGKQEFPNLWKTRMAMIESLDDIISFTIADQTQIEGPRGYVNSKEAGYKLIREISLPLVSYISAMQLESENKEIVYYWKLFVDFEAISERKNGPLVFNYGKITQKNQIPTNKEKKHETDLRNARLGQGKYREALLEECPFCPITMVNDERLLIASHIKPWAASSDKEKTDPHNGYMLTPLYDKLFDKGFITFTDEKHMLVSNWLSPKNIKRLGLKDNIVIKRLPMDEARKSYLAYHRQYVFKG